MAGPGIDDEEYVQLTIPEVFVYKVPPRTSAQGHKLVAAGTSGYRTSSGQQLSNITCGLPHAPRRAIE